MAKHVPISVKLAFVGFTFFFLVALFAPLIATDVPFFVRYKGETYFPALSGDKVLQLEDGATVKFRYANLQKARITDAVYALVPFEPVGGNLQSADYTKPATKIEGRRHWLGTNQIGEDTLSGIINGSRISLQIGMFSMLIALVIGLAIGSVSGYFGNKGVQASKIQVLLFLLLQPIIAFYGWLWPSKVFFSQDASFIWMYFLLTLLFLALQITSILVLSKLKWKSTSKINIPIDNFLGRFMEFVDGLPIFMVLISVSVLTKPSIHFLMILIGLTAWIGIARYTRAEVLKLRNSDFMNAVKVMGMPTWLIVFRHLIPNALGPAMVAFTFGVGGAVLTESALSFIGIGLPSDVKSWGMILAESRSYFNAWWLLWSPGLCIFLLLLCVNTIGQYLRKRLTPAEFAS